MVEFTKHAERRVRQRGCRNRFVERILDNADIRQDVGGGCCLFRVSRRAGRGLKDDRISRFAVVLSEEDNQVVTVVPIHRGARGRRYRGMRR